VVETKFVGSFLVARAVARRMVAAQSGQIVTISMNEHTMTQQGFVPYGPSGAAVDALARVMAEDLAGTNVTANILLPGGGTATGMLPDDVPAEIRAVLLDPAIMGLPIVWLASSAADGVHGERIVATAFAEWLSAR
jgi:NAD(P)-dependent dehydrogenase (short-subunit alcohol dehydrogenase family)